MAGVGFMRPLTHEEIAQNDLVAKIQAELNAARKIVAQFERESAENRRYQDEMRLTIAALEDRIAQLEANIDGAAMARLRGFLETI